jgi:hypothetical protein
LNVCLRLSNSGPWRCLFHSYLFQTLKTCLSVWFPEQQKKRSKPRPGGKRRCLPSHYPEIIWKSSLRSPPWSIVAEGSCPCHFHGSEMSHLWAIGPCPATVGQGFIPQKSMDSGHINMY